MTASALTLAAPARVMVLRALMLGDLLCATPALRALRRGWPQARITLVGLAWAREWALRLASIDDFIALPGWPGLPEAKLDDTRALPRFLAAARARRPELTLQMHGSGAIVNSLAAAFGAPRLAGFAAPEAWRPARDAARFVPWPTRGTEVDRLLLLTDHLGLPRRGRGLDFPLVDGDRDDARRLTAPLHGRPFVLVHAGSQLPSRRWPAERFAAVADHLADAGLAVVLSGSAAERALVASVAAAMRAPALDLAGRTSLFGLGALVEAATLVVCNDTGISHVAAALRRPSVVVSSGGDAARWAPADARLHRVLAKDLPCRPCAWVECPIGHGCATAVSAAEVLRLALAALEEDGACRVASANASPRRATPDMVAADG